MDKSNLIHFYRNFSEYCASKEEYKGLKDPKGVEMAGAEWKVEKYKDPHNEGQYAAYKTSLKEYTTESYHRDYLSLFRELEITNRARHPCTIELLSFDLHDIDHPVVVTKFYEYGSLQSNFGNFDFNSKFAKWGGMKSTPDDSNKSTIEATNPTIYTNLIYGIARGIQYLHKLNIFHRDLKPANIVIDEKYHPHIADYGNSKITDENQDPSVSIVGTYHYMAPEVLNRQYFSFPADIFSLALIFYTISENKNFLSTFGFKKSTNIMTIYKKIRVKYNSGTMFEMRKSNPLYEIITKMWLVDPEQRPKIKEVVDFLENPEHHFKGTVEAEFQKYKAQIDTFEIEQLQLIRIMENQIDNEANDLMKQIEKSKTSDKDNKNDDIDNKKLQATKRNKYTDLQILLKRSLESNKEAECSLGIIFYTGYYGIPKDYATAWYYFNESRKHGNTQSKIFMTNILNEIVEEELRINNEHFSNISINNLEINDPIFQKIRHSNSQLILGMLKESETKYNESYDLYIKSIKQGNKTAKTRLGILLYKTNQHRELCETILTETSRWKYDEDNIKQTPERTLSLLYLGLLKQNRPESLNESIKIFEQLLSEDHPDAALLLGQCYEKKNDIPKAIKYYQLSFDNYSNESAKIYLDYYENLTKNKRKSSKK